ncbi:MAG TPA: thioredoxin [Desulfobacter sp.]|jgi:thioredoxin 1|nr:thioredoxin [Desulfobacter sp.]
MAENVIHLNDEDFDELLKTSEKPILVDFWAPWCGPCKATEPIIEALASEFGDQMTFTKVNVDDNPISPSKHNVQAIPTLLFIKDGAVVNQITGMVAKEKLEEAIKSVL